MVDRADFEMRIAKALYSGWWRRAGNKWQETAVREEWTARALKKATQIADRLPGLFRQDVIEVPGTGTAGGLFPL
jgi:hypothetical protein